MKSSLFIGDISLISNISIRFIIMFVENNAGVKKHIHHRERQDLIIIDLNYSSDRTK